MIRLRTLAVLVAILAAVAARAGAQTPVDPWDACRDTSAPEPAIAACTTVIEQRQGQTEALALAYAARGHARLAGGQVIAALDDYEEAARLNPADPTIYFHRGQAYNARGQFALAIGDFGEAIRLAPDDARAFIARGQTYFYLGRFRAAGDDFARANELAPGDARVALWHHLALLREQGGRASRLRAQAAKLDLAAWPAPVVRHYLGELKPEQVLDAASVGDPATERERFCEAYFYLGEGAVIAGEVAAAAALMRFTIDTCANNQVEYRTARTELSRLAQ
jgi:lipoprotein NlpI